MYSFINFFNSALHVSGDKFAHPQEYVLTIYSFWYKAQTLLPNGALYQKLYIQSVLANSKTKNIFLFTVNAIFLHDYPLAVETGSTPRPLVKKKIFEILYLLICSFLPCLSWLLRSRVRKSRRDLSITVYYTGVILQKIPPASIRYPTSAILFLVYTNFIYF